MRSLLGLIRAALRILPLEIPGGIGEDTGGDDRGDEEGIGMDIGLEEEVVFIAPTGELLHIIIGSIFESLDFSGENWFCLIWPFFVVFFFLYFT